MSDFLFRMVERAAGFATAATPQPPRTFQWMATAEMLPSHYPSTSAWGTQASQSTIESSPAPPPLRQSAAKFNRVTVEYRRNRRDVDVQSIPQPSVRGASSFQPENAVSETNQPSIAVQSTPRRDVKTEATKEAAPRFQNHLPENSEETGHKINVSHLPPEAAAKRQPLARRREGPIIADHEAAHFPLEESAHKASIHAAQPATPLPRESRPQAGDVRIPQPSSEQPVEVKIGRVEIHFDAPPTSVASAAPARPGGFSEYAELRRYASRKR